VRFYAAFLVVLFSHSAAAQFSETLEVRVLEIEATVVDRDQNAIEGLTENDFLITIDDQPAEITNFSFVSRGAIRESAHGSDAVVELPVPTRLIIVIDDLHLHQQSKQRALRALERYVDEAMDASTTAMLITWTGALTTRTTPTTRRDILRSAMAASAKEIPRGMGADAERRQLQSAREATGPNASYRRLVENHAESRAIDVQRTLDALEEIVATAARAVEGRKIVLFISEGIPVTPGVEMFASAVGVRVPPIESARFHKGPRFLDFAKLAAAAGVIFSTLDPSAVAGTTDGGMGDVDLTIDTRMMRDNAHEGVALLARETGGTLIANQNDLDRALMMLDERVSTYYSIAVRPPPAVSEQPRIDVRVKNQPRLRVHVATRRGLPSRDEAIVNAIRTQLTRRNEENPLQARFFVEVERNDDRCTAKLSFLVPAENLALLPPTEALRGQIDLWYTAVDQTGLESRVGTHVIDVTSRHGSTIGRAVPVTLPRGRFVLSVAIVDRLSAVTSYLQRDVDC